MSNTLDGRLNQILPRIASEDFLRGAGLGNELAFHIFDYPPEEEIRVRAHVNWLLEQLPKKRPGIRVVHVNLFDFLIGYLRERKLLDRAFALQRKDGDTALLRALRGPLSDDRMKEAFTQVCQPEGQDLVLMTGVGGAYPIIRVHSLLNNLHTVMGQTPLVLFYPGQYDGVCLRLFGKSSLATGTTGSASAGPAPYYRAFRLIPEESAHAH